MAFPQARLTDACIHTTVITSGSPDTIVGSKPAARLGDLVTPCPVCKAPPGKIVQGSSTVFINSKPAARILDAVACGSPGAPPGGGSHGPVSTYGVKPEDNYVAAVFTDDAYLIKEEEGDLKKPPPPDKPPERKPATFLDGLSLDIDLGSRSAGGGGGGGANAISAGETTGDRGVRPTSATSETRTAPPVVDGVDFIDVGPQHWLDPEWHYRMRVAPELEAFPAATRGPLHGMQRLCQYVRKDALIEVWAERLPREVAAGDWLLESSLLRGKEVLEGPEDALGAGSAWVEATWEVRGKPWRGRVHCLKSGPRMFALLGGAPAAAWDAIVPQLEMAVASFEPVTPPAHKYAEPLTTYGADEPIAWEVSLPRSWLLQPGTSGPDGASFQAENLRRRPGETGELVGKLAFAVLARSVADTARDVAELYLGGVRDHGLDVGSDTVAAVAPRRPFLQAWTLHAPVWREKMPGEVLVRVLCHRSVWVLGGVLTLGRGSDTSAWMQNKRALDLVISSLKLASHEVIE